MSRFASQAVAGFWPTPPRLVPMIAGLVRLQKPARYDYQRFVLFDPCAGDGEAIDDLRRELISIWPENRERYSSRPDPIIRACEMERERYLKLEGRLRAYGDDSRAYHGDAFRLDWRRSEMGASLLYLNPEFSDDRQHKRLEQRFLARFTAALAPGGVLVFVVPARSLSASASWLAHEYRDLRCWRFPDPEFADFGQVVLVARRREERSRVGAAELEALVNGWAKPGAQLWPLPEECRDPLELTHPDEGRYELSLSVEELDLRELTAAHRPLEGEPVGVDLGVDDLIGRAYPVAMPPKPAHLALAVASGQFNGHRLEPDDPRRYPPIILKGVFSRTWEEIEAKVDKKGRQTGSVQVETPRLELYALRLDTYTYFQPAAGAVPSHKPKLEDCNAADLMEHYSGSLAELMDRQFPRSMTRGDPRMRLRWRP